MLNKLIEIFITFFSSLYNYVITHTEKFEDKKVNMR